jgi:mono/diheme cytochrome c family protein
LLERRHHVQRNSTGHHSIAPAHPVRLDAAVSPTAGSASPRRPTIERRSYRWVVAPLLMFALFSLTAGLLAAHDPRSKGYFRLFFQDPLHLKAGFATAAAGLACFQIFSAAWIFGKLPWRRPPWMNRAHRWSGRLAFVFTLPVAYHCIFKLGFRHPDDRVLAHSLLGCAVYGGYAAKVTIVRLRRFPVPVLPIAGGALFAVLIGVWYTSAVWLYTREAPAAAPEGPVVVPANAHAAPGGRVFASNGCGDCHTLHAAGANGQIGPDLDALRPGYEQVREKVERGGGVMPAFADDLTDQQIRDVAAFVATRAGSP